jgi:hypothetical protein
MGAPRKLLSLPCRRRLPIYTTAAYRFSAPTSFANCAVTALSNTFVRSLSLPKIPSELDWLVG